MTTTNHGNRFSHIAMLAVAAILGACDTTYETDESVEAISAGMCNSTLKKQTTTAASAYSSYACAPGLTLSGGETIRSLTVPTAGDVVVSAKGYTNYPFLTVLRDTGTGVNPADCVTGNFYAVRFTATANSKYYIVADAPSAGKMTLDIRIDCQVTSENQCSDGFDNDANFKTDCADPACAASCPTTQCAPSDTLSCGDSLVFGMTGGYGTTSSLSEYTCPSDWTPNAPEHAYTFTPTTSQWVNFTLSEAGDYPMLYVLDDTAGGCSPNNCVSFNYYSNKFYAVAGKTYHLVVDGTGGSNKAYQYLASLVCDPPATETNCNNDIDDDGNGLVDCNDSACMGSPACQQTACVPVATLGCGSTLVPGNTASPGSTNGISSYSCAPLVSLGGPERAYTLGPFASDQDVVVTLSNETSSGMISILQDSAGGCQPSSCVTENYGSVSFHAKHGMTYYAVVEGQDASSVSYDISVVCPAPGNESGLCSDGIDNDGNRLIDCQDSACASVCDNSCTAVGTLTDTTKLLAGSTSAAGSTNTIASYSCYPSIALPGNEYVYQYIPTQSGTVLFTLSDMSNYAAIAVLHDTGHTCNTNSCVAFQYYSAFATVQANSTYYVVVDAPQAGPVDYKISVIPNPPSTEAGLCSDNIDNDGNYLIDHGDPACP